MTKWRNTLDFPRNSQLYNHWFAKDLIRKCGIAILVEGERDPTPEERAIAQKEADEWLRQERGTLF